jgi:type I restriction enzyme S subunit
MVLNIDKSQWMKVQFGDVVQKVSNKIDPETYHSEIVIQGGHINKRDFHIREYENKNELGYLGPAFHMGFKKHQILYVSRNPHLMKVGYPHFDGICANTTFIMETKDESVLRNDLIPFIMHSDTFIEQSVANVRGGVNPYVNFSDLACIEFLLPPKDQQTQLAKLLWAMEEVIEKESVLSDKLKSLFDSFSKKYFKEDVTEYLPLSECSEVIMGQSPPGDSYNKLGKGAPLLNGPTEFTDRYPVKIQWTTKPTKYCEDKDILLCVRGSTTGKMNISNDKYCIGRGVAAIRGKSIFKTDFLEFVLRYNVDEIMRVASGSTFPNIDSKTLKAIKLPKLSKQQQDVIIEKLKNLDETKTEIQNKISQSLQKSIINQIF